MTVTALSSMQRSMYKLYLIHNGLADVGARYEGLAATSVVRVALLVTHPHAAGGHFSPGLRT